MTQGLGSGSASGSGRIVHCVAPGSGGVRDYAELLAEGCRRRGVASGMLELSKADATRRPLSVRLAELAGGGDQRVVLLLHYSGYGFAPRGLCHWLAAELEQTRRTHGKAVHVLTMFHELFASGPPWRSAFWLSPVQASIAARIACASDGLLTNTAHHGRWLQRVVGERTAVQVRPVFSNVGEPSHVNPASGRTPSVVVFGAPETRRRALAALARSAAQLRGLGVETMVEVGAGGPSAAAASPLAHRYAGVLDAAQLGALLQGAAFGLIDSPPAYLAKSSVFAAYAAHGCVVLNTAASGDDADGLQRCRHYLGWPAAGARAVGVDACQRIADAALAWYRSHTAEAQVQALLADCTGVLP